MSTIHAGGVDIPVVGFGTWTLEGDICRRAVEDALRMGYRHLDTAVVYGNEREVGEGLRASGVPREQVFVTTKIPRRELSADLVGRTLDESLERLGVDHVDLLLVHWPSADVPLAETLAAFGRAKREGLTRAIGVSNFTAAMVDEAVALSDEPIATNQVEYHPYLAQPAVLGALRRHGMALTAYSPLARGLVADDPTLTAMAAATGVSVGRLVLRWLIQQGDVIVIPKTASRARAAENLDLFSFSLTDEEMGRVSSLARSDGRQVETGWVAWD